MIPLDAFLIFLGAASLPVIYLFLVSRWIETEWRQKSLDENRSTPELSSNAADNPGKSRLGGFCQA